MNKDFSKHHNIIEDFRGEVSKKVLKLALMLSLITSLEMKNFY